MRWRSVVTPPEHSGEPCPSTEEVVHCFNAVCPTPKPTPEHHCPEDCSVDDWLDWSACTTTCGAGEHMRERIVITSPKDGGLECPNLLEVGFCMVDVCPTTTPAPSPDTTPTPPAAEAEPTTTLPPTTTTTTATTTLPPTTTLPAATTIAPTTPAMTTTLTPTTTMVTTPGANWATPGPPTTTPPPSEEELTTAAPSTTTIPSELTTTSPAETAATTAAPTTSEPLECPDWSDWTECDVTCGGGEQTRHRELMPDQWAGGCPDFGSRTCNLVPCEEPTVPPEGTLAPTPEPTPVDCGEWGDWTSCTTSCESGQHYRFRELSPLQWNDHCKNYEVGTCNCDVPCPEFETTPEPEEEEPTAAPTTSPTASPTPSPTPSPTTTETTTPSPTMPETTTPPPDVVFCGEWGPWSDCSQSCGEGGRHYRFRELTPLQWNAECQNYEITPCNVGPCDELATTPEPESPCEHKETTTTPTPEVPPCPAPQVPTPAPAPVTTVTVTTLAPATTTVGPATTTVGPA